MYMVAHSLGLFWQYAICLFAWLIHTIKSGGFKLVSWVQTYLFIKLTCIAILKSPQRLWYQLSHFHYSDSILRLLTDHNVFGTHCMMEVRGHDFFEYFGLEGLNSFHPSGKEGLVLPFRKTLRKVKKYLTSGTRCYDKFEYWQKLFYKNGTFELLLRWWYHQNCKKY